MIESFLNAPVLIKVIGSLALILCLNYVLRELAAAAAGGAVFLAVWCGLGWEQVQSVFLDYTLSLETLGLILIVFQVIWLSSQMGKSGVMEELVDAVRQRVNKGPALAVLPALIGMLPMPGGAVFSAPLVEDCDREGHLSGMRKTIVNYWFRHVWEYWWPLYPGVLLAVEKTGLDIWEITLLNLPMSFAAIGVGCLFFLRGAASKDGLSEKGGEYQSRLLWLVSPIAVVVITYLIVRFVFPRVGEWNLYLPMIIALAAGICHLQRLRPLSLGVWKEIIFSRKTGMLALLVFVIGAYGAFVDAELPSGRGVMEQMRGELQAWAIPPVLVIVIMPFVTGLSTGLTIGFVGTSFPIVMSLHGASPLTSSLLGVVVLAYSCGYVGILLSPVHVCLLVSNKHFKTDLGRALTRLVLPCVCLALCAAAYFAVIHVLA